MLYEYDVSVKTTGDYPQRIFIGLFILKILAKCIIKLYTVSCSDFVAGGCIMNTIYQKLRIGIDEVLLGIQGAAHRLSGGKIGKLMFTESLDVKKVGTDVRIICEDEDSVTIAKFDENGKIVNKGFRIISTSDLHFGDDPVLRDKTMGMLMRQIEDTRPDLLVLTGDVILGRFQHIDAIQFAHFMEKIGVYWAFVFGNHEAREEKGRFKELLMKCQTNFPHCLARQGKKELFGLCNYCINILGGENGIMQTLFMLDSGRDIIDEYRAEHGCPKEYKGYDYIKNNQMSWYENKLKTLEAKYGKVKSMMYMHIPIKEYELAVEKDENGVFKFSDKCEIIHGTVREAVGSSLHNSGLFALIKRLGSTQAMFCGHDHMNDYCVRHDGVYLVYNQTGGYETYTTGDNFGCDEKDWPQGVTVTDIAPDGEIKISQRFNSIYL